MEPSTSIEALLASCEQEQLHLSGQIQPFGALLKVDIASGIVTHASANLEQFIPSAAADLLGQPAPLALAKLLAKLSPTRSNMFIPNLVMEGRLQPVDVHLLRDSHTILIEFEPISNDGEYLQTFLEYQRTLMTPLATAAEMLIYNQSLVDGIQAITNFAHVMLYRFLEDWSGEVIAESVSPGMESYLGLRFPASDIPAIARNLYLLKPYRIIPDVHAVPVNILSQDATPLDLTFSKLRSVSPVHLLYLNNMSVAAAFSVSILVSGKLWGLVACHHPTPKLLSHRDREICTHLVRCYELGITSFIVQQRLHIFDNLPDKIEAAFQEIVSHQDIQNNLGKILTLLEADGIVLGLGKELLSFGKVPQLEMLARIDNWFVKDNKSNVFATDHLLMLASKIGAVSGSSSGMLAIKVRSPRWGWVRFFWFRDELIRTVSWAGNPNKPVSLDSTAKYLSPRHSFAKWVEEKTGYSRRWSEEEMTIADILRIGFAVVNLNVDICS